MSKPFRRRNQPLEVSIMFEPHRLQDDLLREAYAHLLPEARRRLASEKRPSGTGHIPSPKGTERKIA